MSVEIWNKTAPALLQTLIDYNFQGDPRDIFVASSQKSSCPHVYTTNTCRTFLPQHQNARSEAPTAWTLALTCQLCRCHVDAKVDFGASQLACPSQEFPLHHFCATSSSGNSYPRVYNWKCSYSNCQATLCVILRLPNLGQHEVEYLIDVKPRMKSVLERLPKTKNRNSLEALDVFRTYITDSLWNKGRSIPADNGAFESCLGDGAHTMLLRLGFFLEEENGKSAWKLPQPPNHDKSKTEFNVHRCTVEDVREELTALIQGRPEAEKRGNINDMYPPPPGGGRRDLEQLLGASNYAKVPQANQLPQMADHELYFGLGVLGDFGDRLLFWAYEQQCRTDSSRVPYFFRCLKVVAEKRQTEELITRVVTLESQGIRTDYEIANAFSTIGIDMAHANVLNDENILSKYRSRFQDCGKEEQQRMRQALAVIGEFMQRPALTQVSEGCKEIVHISNPALPSFNLNFTALETYEQALAFIGADANTSDEWILSLATAKKEQEALTEKKTVLKALEIIANTRDSPVLRAHFQEEDQLAPRMDLNTAYNIFGASETADSETIILAFPALLHENTPRRGEIIRAMKTIAEARNNQELLQAAQSALQGSGTQALVPVNPIGYPRGLENIGNTCYLNSFLQYLYTVKPLRDLVQNIGEHEQDASESALSLKKVSDERVTKHQVLRAQNFVHELDKLFEALKTSHNGAVTLDKRLAALTVAPTGDWTAIREQEKRRRSTMVSPLSPKISLFTTFTGNQNGLPSSADSGTVFAETPREETASARASDKVFWKDSSDFEDETAKIEEESIGVEPWPSLEQQDSPEAISSNTSGAPEKEKIDTVELSRPKAPLEQIVEPEETNILANTESHLPPVPPRQEGKTAKPFTDTSTEKIEEWARQQDMREALANVFRQLRWAIKGDNVNNKGDEQVDLISSLFYGKENVVTLHEGGETRTETIPFHNFNLIPDEKYESIYGMLDGAYGFREVESQPGVLQYSTFSNLPPVLHIDVAVTAWDKEANHAVRRAPFKVAESFYMDRYLDDATYIGKRRVVSELMSSLELLRRMKAEMSRSELDLDAPSTLGTVNTYLEALSESADQIGIDKNLISADLGSNLLELGDEISAQLTQVDNEITQASNKLSAFFPEGGQHLYRLHAVCMHTGRADSGHYFIYIYDTDSRCWYKYNDETVEFVDNTRPILDPNGGISDGIPAMLVYVREPEGQGIMNTVCRESEDLPQETILAPVDISSNEDVSSAPANWEAGKPASLDKITDW